MRYFVSERLALLPFAEVKGPRGNPYLVRVPSWVAAKP